MTSETTPGRQLIQLVEIQQPRCALTYGVAPCTAAIGTTGTDKCYNTNFTCQDTANYDGTDLIKWRFTTQNANRGSDFYADDGTTIENNPIPSLISASTSPTKLNVGGGDKNVSPFGRRSALNVVLKDHAWDDSIEDKYVSERSYDAFTQGSFWGKWLARDPYYSQYVCIVYDGYFGQALSAMYARTYQLEKIDGPTRDMVRIVAKDPLRIADDKRSVIPRPIEATLSESLDNSQTSGIRISAIQADLTSQIGVINAGSHVGDLFIRIKDEIISYTSIVAFGAFWELVGATRAELGTTASAYSINEKVSRVAHYNCELQIAAQDLLQTYAGVSSAYIPIADWTTERDAYLTLYDVEGTIEKPTSINKLMGELSEQCLLNWWWDERDTEIKMLAIRPIQGTPPEWNDDFNIIDGQLSIKADQSQRISRVIIYYNKIDESKNDDETGNWQSVTVRIDANAETAEQYNESRTRIIYSRWLTTNAQAFQVAVRLLARYRDYPHYMTLQVDAKDRASWTGDIIEITTRHDQDVAGADRVDFWQIVTAEEVTPGHTVEYELQRFEFGGIGGYAHYMGNTANDWDNATDAEKLLGAWHTDINGRVPSDNLKGYPVQ